MSIDNLYNGSSPHLPSYVLDAIKQQQASSERLISWTLLIVIGIFTTLFVISPKAFTDTTGLAPVPWVLSSYLVFALFRLYLSYKIELPGWFLFLSIFLDIFLLMTLVWSFHLQYHQPAAFYLKAPTLLYIFIFIAVRALRFEAKYVLFTGLLAATAWLFMLIYAINDSPAGSVTQDYVQYLTTNSILIGGEVDKVLSILIVTFILTLAVIRARRLLTYAVYETMALEDLSKFFAPEIASSIIESGHDIEPGFGELRDVAMLHCDIRGFTTELARTNPNEVMQLLTEYQAIVVSVLHKHEGSVDKFLGDGILASFNALQPSKQFAKCAIEAGLEIAEKVDAWNEERKASGLQSVSIGISIATGTALLGVVGNVARMEYTIIGEPVNLVAKLDKHCKVLNCQVLATEEAFDLAISQGYEANSTVSHLIDQTVNGLPRVIDLAVLK